MSSTIQRDLYRDLEYTSLYPATVPLANPGVSTDLHMIGTGDQCETGGQKIPMICPSCKTEIQINTVTCGRVSCPTCWPTWARRAAERAAARVMGCREVSHTKYLPRHATFELDAVDWKEANKKALALGFTGGVIIIHPWRIRDEYKPMLAQAAEATGKSRYDLAREMMSTVDVLIFSPHAHVVCYGKGVLVEKGSTEYQYKMIRRCNNLRGVQAVIFYLLSHTFVPESPRKHVVRYFGNCSPQRLKPTWTSKRSDFIRCPHCNEPMVYPGTSECKEVSCYIAGGWHFVEPKPGRHKAALASPPSLPAGLTDLV